MRDRAQCSSGNSSPNTSGKGRNMRCAWNHRASGDLKWARDCENMMVWIFYLRNTTGPHARRHLPKHVSQIGACGCLWLQTSWLWSDDAKHMHPVSQQWGLRTCTHMITSNSLGVVPNRMLSGCFFFFLMWSCIPMSVNMVYWLTVFKKRGSFVHLFVSLWDHVLIRVGR